MQGRLGPLRGSVAAALLAACAPGLGARAEPLRNATDSEGDLAVVALVATSEPTRLLCTGARIAERIVLTAAHCGAQDDPASVSVVAGARLDLPEARAPVLAAVAHPDWDGSAQHDLALLLLAAPLLGVPWPGAPLEIADDPPALDTARLVGWGVSAPDASDGGRKRTGTARIIEIGASDLVLAAEPTLPCHGDSGGPVLVGPPGDEVIAAVISRGDAACGVGARATRTDVHTAFIRTQLARWADGSLGLGERCLDDPLCASGLCEPATDDPTLRFCARACSAPAECEAPLACIDGLCRHPPPSPGAFGAPCATDGDCARGECALGVCTVRCVAGRDACPGATQCTHTGGIDFYCLAPPPRAGCSAGPERASTSTALIAGLALAAPHARRRTRRRRGASS